MELLAARWSQFITLIILQTSRALVSFLSLSFSLSIYLETIRSLAFLIVTAMSGLAKKEVSQSKVK